jgi:hypothetical protein
MCLSKIDRQKKRYRIGYKVFDRVEGSNIIVTSVMRMCMTMGCNYVDRSTKKIASSCGKTYKSGFHFFRKIEDAQKYASEYGEIVVKVRVSKLTATGYQWFKCYDEDKKFLSGCAKEITLLEIMENNS